MRISLSVLSSVAAGVADPSVHLPVAFGRRWGRAAPGAGRCAVTQRMPRSRALVAHREPPSVCMSAMRLLQRAAPAREKRRIKLNHVRSLLPVQRPAQGTSQQGQRRREGDWSQCSFSGQEPHTPGKLGAWGREESRQSLSTAAPVAQGPGIRAACSLWRDLLRVFVLAVGLSPAL